MDHRFDQYIVNQSPAWFDYGQLLAAANSRYSSLMPWHITNVAQALTKEIDFNFTRFVDTGANIGCDSILFRILYPDVNIEAFENDPSTFELLKCNVRNLNNITKTDTKEITVYNANCLDYLFKMCLLTSIVYFDPPWQNEYKNSQNIDLYLSNMNVVDIISYIKSPLIILKVPVNYNFDALSVFKRVTAHGIHTKTKISYYLVFIRK